jgi:hypothetical protein
MCPWRGEKSWCSLFILVSRPCSLTTWVLQVSRSNLPLLETPMCSLALQLDSQDLQLLASVCNTSALSQP